jgi:hypothetical protein
VNKISLSLSLVVLVSFALFLQACTKINEATELGGDLIPAVDNIHTFEAILPVEATNRILDSTDFLSSTDDVGVGTINDPEFGKTRTDAYFNLSSSTYGVYPFLTSAPGNPDSLQIDSVILSLHYVGSFGDSNSLQTIKVLELDPNQAALYDTAAYTFEHAAFPTTTQLGTATFTNSQFKNPIPVSFKQDNFTLTNVLRIPLNKSLGTRFAGYTSVKEPAGGFYNDSIFKLLFRGLKLQADDVAGTGSLAYFNLTDTSSKLSVYFRKRNLSAPTSWDTLQQTFVHNASTNTAVSAGQANFVQRTNSGPFSTYINNGPGSDDLIYLQTAPRPSYASIRIPALNSFPNAVIHRAELIAVHIPTASDPFFSSPLPQLYLDRIDSVKKRGYLLENDLSLASDGSISFTTFGGSFKGDSARINVSRYVQGIVTRHNLNDTLGRRTSNDSLRLYIPYRANDYARNININVLIPITQHIAAGRVVIGGPTNTDPSKRLRLRIIYSTL